MLNVIAEKQFLRNTESKLKILRSPEADIEQVCIFTRPQSYGSYRKRNIGVK